MPVLFALSLLGFALCFLLTPLTRDLALRFGFVDYPDSMRKLHDRAVPRVGGVAIMLSYGFVLLSVLAFEHYGHMYIQHESIIRSLLPAGTIIFITGLADDLFTLRPWQKLLGQIAGAMVAVHTGTVVAFGSLAAREHTHFWSSAWVSVPFSIFWLVGSTNAVNLVDGIDGLAAGVGLFATGTALVFALLTGNTGLALATLPLAACLLAFLFYNSSPASIFLGDSGSLSIGFLLGCFALIWCQHSPTILGFAAPLMVLVIPLLDVLLAVCRRYLRHVPIFVGDRGHIHHRMLARGFTPRQASWLLYVACGCAAVLALLQRFSSPMIRIVAVLLFLTLMIFGVRYLDYIELGAVRRLFSRKQLLGIVRDEIFLLDIERILGAAQPGIECWEQIQIVCDKIGFCNVELHLEGAHFERYSVVIPPEVEWRISLPLSSTGFLTLSRAGHGRAPRLTTATLNHVQEALSKREAAYSARLTRTSFAPASNPTLKRTA